MGGRQRCPSASLFVSDPKGELLDLCTPLLARRGYDVLSLDLAHPRRGDRYNPLEAVARCAAEGRPDDAAQAAEELAAALIPPTSDPYWSNSARGALAACALVVATDPSVAPSQRHMASVCRLIDGGTTAEGDDPAAPLKRLFRSLPAGDPARAMASQLMGSRGKEQASVLSTLKQPLRMFASPAVAWATSAGDIDPERALRQRTAVFLRTMDEGSPYNALLALFFDQLYRAASELVDRGGGRLPLRAVVVGDEWGNLPAVASLPGAVSLGRSYGMSYYLFVQNLAQLNKYGERDGRPKILANCGVKVALKLGEREDREYFTELVGRTTRLARSSSRSSASSGQRSASTSGSERADDVVRPWEWTWRAPDRDGCVVVKMAENGVPRSHAGAFLSPLRDATRTPTGRRMGLGSRERERRLREESQAALDARAAARVGEAADVWEPRFPEPEAPGAGSAGEDEDEWSAFA